MKNSKTNGLKELVIEVPHESYDIFSSYLEEFLPKDCYGYYEIMYDEENSQKTKKFVLYFSKESHNVEWELETILLSLGISEYYIDSNLIEDQDYWQNLKETFPPFFLSENFYLIPIWDGNPQKDHQQKLPIFIEPGIAFGTGLHPTTQLAIEWIDENPVENQFCLDAGCGSGILSIALLRKNAKKIVAFDVDSLAIESTKKNLYYNFSDWEQKMELYLGSWDLPQLMLYTFDIIIANLTLPIFAKYMNYIKHLQTRKIIVTGISEEQDQECQLIFDGSFILNHKKTKGGWILFEYIAKK
ncbi:MAG: 50S ribosomal protein L11 methyltransferase [Leptonema sp. (in: bacteria)]